MQQIIALALVLLASQPGLAQTKPAKPIGQPVAKRAPAAKIQQFANGIKIKSKGFVIKEASLYFDDERPVLEDNRVELNERVNMLIIIDSGWHQVNGQVYPGGSEVIKLNTGKEVLNSGDLFAAYDQTGVSPADARYIILKAKMTEMADKDKYVIVTFRVWDKKGNAELTGSYKLFIK
jgi:hypothetical protein